MTDEEQARALALWLEGDVNAPPPPDLDPEVVEAIYALRPERAPAPQLDIDDIPGGVCAIPRRFTGTRGRSVRRRGSARFRCWM